MQWEESRSFVDAHLHDRNAFRISGRHQRKRVGIIGRLDHLLFDGDCVSIRLFAITISCGDPRGDRRRRGTEMIGTGAREAEPRIAAAGRAGRQGIGGVEWGQIATDIAGGIGICDIARDDILALCQIFHAAAGKAEEVNAF